MPLQGLGFGAAQGLEKVLERRYQQQQLEALIASREAALAESQRSSQADEAYRNRSLDIQEAEGRQRAEERATAQREKANVLGVRRMAGEFITQGQGEFTPDQARGLAGLQIEVGQIPDTDLLRPPPEKKYPVTTTGPGGGPVNRLVTEGELSAGVPGYRAPNQPPQPQHIQYTDPEGNLQTITPEQLAAQGGVPTLQRAGSQLGSAPIRLRAQRTASALNAVEKLKQIAPQRSPGLPGLIQGAGQTVQGYLGQNTQARQYNALLQPTAMQMAVAIQGAANLSDSERQAMANQLGSISTMDYGTQMALLDNALEMLRNNAEVQQVTTKDPQTGLPTTHWVPAETGPLRQGATVDLPTPEAAAAPQQKSIPGVPGGVAELRNGKWIRIK